MTDIPEILTDEEMNIAPPKIITDKEIEDADFKNFWGRTGTIISESSKATLRGFEGIGAGIGATVRWLGEMIETGEKAKRKIKLPGTDVGEKIGNKIAKMGQTAYDFWRIESQRGIEAPNPKIWQGSFMQNPSWTRGVATVAEAIPSLAAATAVTIATGNPLAGAGALGLLEGSEQYIEARKAGKSIPFATGAGTLSSVGNTILEVIPLTRFLRGGSGKLTKDIFIGAIQEGSEEVLQALWSNIIAKIGYDKTRDLTEGMVEGFIGGAGSGGVLGGITSGRGMNTDKLMKEAVNKGVTPREIEQMQEAVKNQIVNKSNEIDKVIDESQKGTSEKIGEFNSVQKVISALEDAESVRRKQETIYSKERAKRLVKARAVGQKIKGEKGFYAELGQLKGEMRKAEFEAIRDKLTQDDIDNLFIQVKDSSLLDDWQKISARTGLAKLFGEYGGVVPTEKELILLERIFGQEFTKTLLGKRDLWRKMKEAGYQVANIPRSVMASFDLSAPFRQGIFFVGRGKQFWPAFSKMFKLFVNEKYFNEIQQEIFQRPTYKLMNEGGLALTSAGQFLNLREEQFMSSWAEKIPLIGKGVRASERAYVGFLNKVRADVFDDLIKKAEKIGLNPRKNKDLLKEIAHFVNVGTGRGSLGGLERAAVGLNAFFFSPRLMASRLTLLNPVYYITRSPFVRKEALKSLFSFAGMLLTTLTLAKLAGLKVGADPRSADFGKIIIRNTRIDLLGGFQQYLRMAGQLITGQYVSSTTGKIITLGEGYKPLTRLDIIQRQIETKQAPIFSFATSLLKGQTFTGEKVNIPKEVGLRFVPMVAQDMYDLYKEDSSLLPLGGLAIFGVGIQTYRAPTRLEKWQRKKEASKNALQEWRRKKQSERQ